MTLREDHLKNFKQIEQRKTRNHVQEALSKAHRSGILDNLSVRCLKQFDAMKVKHFAVSGQEIIFPTATSQLTELILAPLKRYCKLNEDIIYIYIYIIQDLPILYNDIYLF